MPVYLPRKQPLKELVATLLPAQLLSAGLHLQVGVVMTIS